MRALAESTPSKPAEKQAPKKTRIVFIDIGRAVGALLVFYSHIAHEWVETKGEHAPYISFLEALTSNPMHMAKQGIGEVAVPFFFLVSGFVVTPIALRQGIRRFSANRLIRVYVPIVFVVLLTTVVILVHLHPPSTGQPQTLNPLTVLTNSLLVNYLIVPQVVLIPVAWSMIVEVLFYLVLLAVLPLLRRSVWLTIAVELTFVFVVLMSARQFSASYFLFAVNVSYLAIPLIGQIIWAATAKKIPLWAGGIFIGTAWALYVLGDVINVGRIDSSYNLSLAFAVLCFLLGMFAEPKLRQRRGWTALSERSYSIYLLHSLVAFVLLDLMRPAIPLPIALVLAIAAVFGVVELSYRYVERPSHTLARRLSHGSQPKPEPIPVSAEITIELPPVPPRPRPRPPRAAPPKPQPRPNATEETAIMRPVRRVAQGRHAAPRHHAYQADQK
ncbi:acyltransferase family protein [Amycolatopsis alkalitolerans]|uniref:Acyltransferase n=1 Tax=Amycolatopsis alkalitolerans TaxID=2547244 RepID=A0A5C4M2W6_9PSEU|nr:acyltransferase [Amycolatopsis alkalitolerans]TNC27351.1 acyltransferase [Amycolatopsis alkalitolerans]